MLSHTHYDSLINGSGISDEVVRQRGYRTVTDAAELRALGFAPAQCRPPGLLLPLWTTNSGQLSVDSDQSPLTTDHRPLPTSYVFRPDSPRVYDDKYRGKLPDGTYHQRVIKYEIPKGDGVRVDCPPACRAALGDPAIPLFITEGQKKADALASRGACAIALLGVWNFKGRNDFGGTTLLADFDYIALDNRPVYLVFDSDVMSKRGVRAALERLTEHLKRKRAAVHTIYLPAVVAEQGGRGAGEHGSLLSPLHPRPPAPLQKLGVDDWLVATGKGIEELIALAEGPRPEPTAAPPLTTLLDLAPSRMSRPLALIDGRAYAATWAWAQTTETESVNRRGEIVRHDPPRVTVDERLFIVRDDGVIFGDGGDKPAAEAGLLLSLPEVLPPALRLSPAGLRAYRAGRRPDPADVFRRVCACVDRFIDFDRSLADQRTMVEMAACFIMATWFLDAFTVAGFLWPNGDRGSGKTQLLIIIAELAYLGQLVLAGGSFAALRDLADYGATLAFDDAENLADPRKTDPDKRTLLLAGNRRGNSVPLKEKDETGWRLRYVNTFSFRLFSATQLPDSILASRTIVVPLIRTPDRYRANADPMDYALWPHDRQGLVDDLWMLALAHLPELGRYEAAVNAESSLTGRNLEPWRALLAVAGWLSSYELRATSYESGRRSELVTQHSSLVTRMMALSVAYQQERPNVEMSDMTALVIRALGLIVGKMVKEECSISSINAVSSIYIESEAHKKSHFIATTTITGAAQLLIETNEMDVNPDLVTSRRIGRVLTKMRLKHIRQPGSNGKRGWMISLADVDRWANSYGLELQSITGLNITSFYVNGANGTNGANGADAELNLWEGVL